MDIVRPTSDRCSQYPIICADGAANLLHHLELQKQPTLVPTVIIGDLDSVQPDVLQFYQRKGTLVTKDVSENSDDFHKALSAIPEYRQSSSAHLPTVVIGGYGGRFDQTSANINALYIEAQRRHSVYWIGNGNIILVLPQGENTISIDAAHEGPACGLIPIGGSVTNVTTEGLRWNLTDQKLSFGRNGLISTSNHIVEPTVLIRNSQSLLWTTQFRLL